MAGWVRGLLNQDGLLGVTAKVRKLHRTQSRQASRFLDPAFFKLARFRSVYLFPATSGYDFRSMVSKECPQVRHMTYGELWILC